MPRSGPDGNNDVASKLLGAAAFRAHSAPIGDALNQLPQQGFRGKVPVDGKSVMRDFWEKSVRKQRLLIAGTVVALAICGAPRASADIGTGSADTGVEVEIGQLIETGSMSLSAAGSAAAGGSAEEAGGALALGSGSGIAGGSSSASADLGSAVSGSALGSAGVGSAAVGSAALGSAAAGSAAAGSAGAAGALALGSGSGGPSAPPGGSPAQPAPQPANPTPRGANPSAPPPGTGRGAPTLTSRTGSTPNSSIPQGHPETGLGGSRLTDHGPAAVLALLALLTAGLAVREARTRAQK
ncbi:hypothetical protein LTV02_07290 [Nocardia yamanashiensis]|uniref:hypothetical protein n=1 Tax=Nocardia yamanashiensis TaxID=209247 RepID=UPI001E5915E5|nr:hypothetical protein [Nocardia yamanashiensis]UGT43185.1 hypothetical protein LTV02_07290 [Nocardia yamanashiensis]